jgi:ubiquinone/menaquinone biosynthesis C-methylase UbiE
MVTKKVSPSYDWEAFRSWNPLRRYWKSKLASKVWSMVAKPPKAVLDIGCGSSPIITHFPNAIGIDIDKDKLVFMQTKVENKLLHMDAHGLGFKDESFDLILCIETLEHLKDVDKAMSEISRCLKKGKRVIIATPDSSKVLWKIVQFLYDRFMPGGYRGGHTSLMTRDFLIQLAARHNLSLEKMEYVLWCDMVALFRKGG